MKLHPQAKLLFLSFLVALVVRASAEEEVKHASDIGDSDSAPSIVSVSNPQVPDDKDVNKLVDTSKPRFWDKYIHRYGNRQVYQRRADSDIRMVRAFVAETLRTMESEVSDNQTEYVVERLLVPRENGRSVFSVIMDPFSLKNAIESPRFGLQSIGHYGEFIPKWLQIWMRYMAAQYQLFSTLPKFLQKIFAYPSGFVYNRAMSMADTLRRSGKEGGLRAKMRGKWAKFIRSILTKRVRGWLETATEGLQKMNMAKQLNAELLISDTSGLDMSAVPPELALTVKSTLLGYFDAMPFIYRKNMLAAYFEAELDADPIDILFYVLNEAGPVMLKLLQLIGGNVKDPKFKERMKQLKSNVKPMSNEEASQLLREAYRTCKCNIVDHEFLNDKPLGSASIGQVHDVKLIYEVNGKRYGRNYAVKIRRSGVQETVEKEFEVITKSLKGKKEFDIVLNQVRRSIMEELDYRLEYELLKEGHTVYNLPSQRLRVPEAVYVWPHDEKEKIHREQWLKERPSYHGDFIQRKGPVGTVLVMEKAGGKALANVVVTPKNACGIARVWDNWVTTWLRTAILSKSTFFHADTHEGNIMYQESKVVNGDGTGNFWIVDFGNAHHLPRSTAEQFFFFGLGLVRRNMNNIMKGLGKPYMLHFLSKEEKDKWIHLDTRIRQIISKATKANGGNPPSITDVAPKIIYEATEMKLDMPQFLIEFIRAIELSGKVQKYIVGKFGTVFEEAKCTMRPFDEIVQDFVENYKSTIALTFPSLALSTVYAKVRGEI